MRNQQHFDVVIVGASVAGCTAASLYARRGLNVALLERTNHPQQFKQVCTHYIQPAAVPSIRKLSLAEKIEAAGAVRNELEVYTEWGWIRPASASKLGHGYNIRRETLDPILRNLATSTPGVHYFPGVAARDLLHEASGRIRAVIAQTPDGDTEFVAPLVVAADGRNSQVAKLAGVRTHCSENERFTFFTYYRGIGLRSQFNSQYWQLHPDLAYAFQNDDDTTLLGIFLPRNKLKEFQQDPLGNFRRFWDRLPNGPRIGDAQPICELRGITKIPNQWRPAAAPGLALVGDAAMVLDPIWGTGCSFAFLSADWLVEQTTPALSRTPPNTHEIDSALAKYQRLHRARTRGHFWHIASFSKVRRPNWVERLLFSAATRDSLLADRVLTYFARTIGISQLASPANLIRATAINAGWTRKKIPARVDSLFQGRPATTN